MIVETRHRLREWGKWARGEDATISSMFKAIFGGRGGHNSSEMPPHIQEIDHIVCTSPRDIRVIFIKFYCSTGTFQDKAIALGLDRRELRRRVERADYYANSRLDGFTDESVNSRSAENSHSTACQP